MNTAKRLIKVEKGSVLPAVLITIFIITLMVGMIMAGTVMQGRFIQQDIKEVQARYTAEGAVFQYLSSDSIILKDSMEVVLPDSQKAIVYAEPFGGYLKMMSKVKRRHQDKKIRMLIGHKPKQSFKKAVILGDISSKLNLTGSAIIKGDITTGPHGVKKRAFKGELFSGSIQGHIHKQDSSGLPTFDSQMLRDEIKHYDKLIRSPPENAKIFKRNRFRAEDILNSGNESQILFFLGDVEIFSRKPVEWPESLIIVSKGTIRLNGNIEFGAFSKFIAGEKIVLQGEIKGKQALFYAAKEISLKGKVNCSAQFLSQKKITLNDKTYLHYPSFLYVNGTTKSGTRSGSITLKDKSILDGIALIPNPQKKVTDSKIKITIGERARIRGALYNSGQTELLGSILGSVQTFQFYFYKSPTSYINWIKDAVINVDKRPQKFAVPIGFIQDNSYEILAWREL